MGTVTIHTEPNQLLDQVRYPDGTTVPRTFKATGRPTGAEVDVAVDIEVDATGKPRCVGLEIRDDDGAGISSTTLRNISLPGMVKEAVAVARGMSWKKTTADGVAQFTPVGVSTGDYGRFLEEVRAPHKGSPITPEHLKLIAKWYRAAQSDRLKPAVVISQKAGVSLATAYRWLKAARESGAIKGNG